MLSLVNKREKDRKEQRTKRQRIVELAEVSIERVDCPSILPKPLLVERF
jgi:hypothetical protein